MLFGDPVELGRSIPDLMRIDEFKMELSDMLHPLELQYRQQYDGDYTDENINEFIYANKEAIYADIEAVKARLFPPPVPDAMDKQSKLNVHYLWAQLVYNLKGLHDDNLPPMFGD